MIYKDPFSCKTELLDNGIQELSILGGVFYSFYILGVFVMKWSFHKCLLNMRWIITNPQSHVSFLSSCIPHILVEWLCLWFSQKIWAHILLKKLGQKKNIWWIHPLILTCPSCLFSGLILSFGTHPLFTKILCLLKN